MNETDPKRTYLKKSPGKSFSSGARKVGYFVAIVVMIVLIYVLRHLRQWGFDFLTDDFGKCLRYIEFSIYVSIGAQVLFIIYDNRWFKHIINGISNIAGAVALIMIYVIFPFDIEDGTWIKWIKIGILILFGLTVISILVEIIKGIRDLLRDPEAV
jgi:hypothetical protein